MSDTVNGYCSENDVFCAVESPVACDNEAGELFCKVENC